MRILLIFFSPSRLRLLRAGVGECTTMLTTRGSILKWQLTKEARSCILWMNTTSTSRQVAAAATAPVVVMYS